TAVKRFLREATTAASIHHDHVVTIHAVNDSHVPPYLVMQFIEGQTLQQKIDREGALGLKHILRIGSQSAAGLAAAQKLGALRRRVCDHTPRPIREINDESPAWLEAIVNKLLAKDPSDRFQSVAEVAELLEQCLAHVQERGSGVPPAMVGWDQRAQLAPAHH